MAIARAFVLPSIGIVARIIIGVVTGGGSGIARAFIVGCIIIFRSTVGFVRWRAPL